VLARAALLICHDAGGKAAALLETSARLLRQKLEMQEKVKTLTAEGRLSAWVVGLSPFGLIAAFQLLSPEYLVPFFSSRSGFLIFFSIVLLVATGLFFVHQVVKVEP
jgi:tight adherence protein B